MRYLTEPATPGQQVDTLVIWLPGAYHQPEAFITEGFVSAVRERGLNIDLILAELAFEHIADQRALADIHNSLIQPAITAGYQYIWLAGISIGGYVAMACADRYPELLEGLLLLAPYPGNRSTTGEIAQAGGIAAWLPEAIAAEDTERSNWLWLKTQASTMQVHLGYGEDDRFAPGHALMAQALPAANVDRIPGGHDWPVWLKLWHNFLDNRFGNESHAR